MCIFLRAFPRWFAPSIWASGSATRKTPCLRKQLNRRVSVHIAPVDDYGKIDFNKPLGMLKEVTGMQGVALSPFAIWISSRAGVFYSKDNGVTWEHVLVGVPPQNLMSVRYDGAARRLLGLTRFGDVYSTSDGQTWTDTRQVARTATKSPSATRSSIGTSSRA